MRSGPGVERRSVQHPLRRAKDYRVDGSRTRTWSGPERSMRLGYRARPLSTVVLIILLALFVSVVGVSASTIRFSQVDIGPADKSIVIAGAGRVVTLGASGFALQSITVPTGATVSVANVDAVPHDLLLDPPSYPSCEGKDSVIPAGTYRACTFDTNGVYTMTAPGAPGRDQRLSIQVVPASAALTSVVLKSASAATIANQAVNLSGATNVPRAGIAVDLIAKVSGSTQYRSVARVLTDANGMFSVSVRPRSTSTYLANAISDGTVVTSSPTTVFVTGGTASTPPIPTQSP